MFRRYPAQQPYRFGLGYHALRIRRAEIGALEGVEFSGGRIADLVIENFVAEAFDQPCRIERAGGPRKIGRKGFPFRIRIGGPDKIMDCECGFIDEALFKILPRGVIVARAENGKNPAMDKLFFDIFRRSRRTVNLIKRASAALLQGAKAKKRIGEGVVEFLELVHNSISIETRLYW